MSGFGPTLDQFRRNQGITLNELADQLGVSRNTITNWKANGRPPKRDDVKKLAKQLYLDEEETDILLTSAGYASEYASKKAQEITENREYSILSDNKRYNLKKYLDVTAHLTSFPGTSRDPDDVKAFHKKFLAPFMVEDLPNDFVQRPGEFNILVDNLLKGDCEIYTAITAALHGAGGFGKTTLAQALCHDSRIKEAFQDGILWVTLGQNPSNLVRKIEDLIYVMDREKVSFSDLDAATFCFSEQLNGKKILLVIDDVWYTDHLKPFLRGGKHCVRLITTRDDRVLPDTAYRVQVDSMQKEEALQLLCINISPTPDLSQRLQLLVSEIGEWPLLLKLANSALRERVRRGDSVHSALAYIEKGVKKRGLTFFDNQNAQSCEQAVAVTLNASFALLSIDQYTRYKELSIFPEDIDIPL